MMRTSERKSAGIRPRVAGSFQKFGSGVFDPIWPVDIYQPQAGERRRSSLHAGDAINGFLPYYPLCLQKAHENAAMVDMDFDILQDAIFDAIRTTFAEDAPELDTFRFQDVDVSQHRYS